MYIFGHKRDDDIVLLLLTRDVCHICSKSRDFVLKFISLNCINWVKKDNFNGKFVIKICTLFENNNHI